MVFQRGMLVEQYLNTSTTSRMEGLGRIDVGAPGDVLLENIVLEGAADAGKENAPLLGDDRVEAQEHRRRGVNGHGRADLV